MEDRLTWYVSWLAYPLVMAAALLLHVDLASRLDSTLVSANLPVVLAALAVTLLEFRFPNRHGWRPGRREIGNDIGYMVVVQMLLPRIVIFVLIILMVEPIQARWSIPAEHRIPAAR